MSEMSDDGSSVEFLGSSTLNGDVSATMAAAAPSEKKRTKTKVKKTHSSTSKPSKDAKKVTADDASTVSKSKGKSKTAAAAKTKTSSATATAATEPLKKTAPKPVGATDKKAASSNSTMNTATKRKAKKKKPTATAPPPPPASRASGMLSVLDLCNDDDEGAETEDDTPLRRSSPQQQKRPAAAAAVFHGGPHAGGNAPYDDGVSSVDEDDSASVVDSESGSVKMPPKKRAKKAKAQPPRRMLPTFSAPRSCSEPGMLGDAGGEGNEGDDGGGDVDMDDDEDDDDIDEGWSDHNRWYCNICKDGGELLCCDRCPRAFHMSCLGMTGKAIPDTEWYCKMCSECLDRRRVKKENREKARMMREAAKLERDETKRQLLQEREDFIAQKNVEAIEHKAKRVLEMQDRILSRKKIKYKDKEEEKLGKLAEDLAITVRVAKDKLEKLEKEDASLKKKEEAFNKKKKPSAEEMATTLAEGSTSDKPPPAPCAFGDFSSAHIGDLLAVWDCLHSFASVVELAPFTLEQFTAALIHKTTTDTNDGEAEEKEPPLLTEIHMCLLNLILEDREEEDYVSDDEASMDEAERFRFEIQHAPVTVGVPTTTLLNSVSWPSVLYNLVFAVPRYAASVSTNLKRALDALNSNEYQQLSLANKLALLKFLIGRAYNTEKFRKVVGKHVHEGIDTSKEFSRAAMMDRKVAVEEEKKLREKQRIELSELVEKSKSNLKVWLKNDKKPGDAGSAMVGDTETSAGNFDESSLAAGVSASSTGDDSEFDDLSEEALSKNEEDLERLQMDGYISRHEYLSRKKLLDAQREKLRRRAEEKIKKQKSLEQQERKRLAAKKGIQEGLVSKDPSLLKIAIEKAKECDLPDRIIVSASHVLEILEAEAIRDEEADLRKKKFNKTMRELVVRTEPLGRDKRGLRYWVFRGDKAHLYIEQPSTFDMKKYYDSGATEHDTDAITPSAWFWYGSQAEITALVAALDERHPQEAQLRLALKESFESITDEMPVSKPGLLLSDLLHDHDAKKRANGNNGKRPSSASQQHGGSGASASDFLSWRNTKKSWKKKYHLEDDVDAFRGELLSVEAWLARRLKELGSSLPDATRSDWLKSVKAMVTASDASKPLLALENEVMAFQLRAQSLLAGSSSTATISQSEQRNGKSTTASSSSSAGAAKDPEKSEEEDDEDDEDLEEEEEAAADDGTTLWPTTKSRDRWISEVSKARTFATLAAALGAFVQRLDVFGLSEFASDDTSTVTTRRAKSEKEKQSRKERAVKKKQKKDADAGDDDMDDTASTGKDTADNHSVDDWEEDCYICTEGGELLCCDGCPRVFHFPCVGLRRVPRGKTFCHHCDSTVKPVYPVLADRAAAAAARSARSDHVKASSAAALNAAERQGGEESGEHDAGDSDSDDSDVELAIDTGSLNAEAAVVQPAKHPEDQWDVECGVCRLGGELLCCDGCPRAYHTQCIDLKSVPEDEWFCDECNLQTCGSCKKNKIRLDSHVICGSEDGTKGCERVFHLKCAKLARVPEDDWYCGKCRKAMQK